MIHPTVTLIIPTYNRPQRLCECLTAVAALDYPRDRFDVVVVDDGSPQPVAPVVEEVVASTKAKLGDSLRAQTIRQQNAGPAAARNAGAHHATGNFLAFTDDDCAPDPNWLHRMAAQLDQQPNALVGGRTVNALVDNPVSEAAQSLIDYIYCLRKSAARRRALFRQQQHRYVDPLLSPNRRLRHELPAGGG